MKKYSNYVENDVTRIGWKDLVKPSDKPIQIESNLKNNIVVHKKETFENTNNIINSLQSEIIDLKRQVSYVSQKDTEIYKLQCDNKKIQSELDEYKHSQYKIIQLEKDLSTIKKTVNDQHKQLIDYQKIKDENRMLKQLFNKHNISIEKSNKSDDTLNHDNESYENKSDDTLNHDNKSCENESYKNESDDILNHVNESNDRMGISKSLIERSHKVETDSLKKKSTKLDETSKISIKYNQLLKVLRSKSHKLTNKKIINILEKYDIISDCTIHRSTLQLIISELSL